MSKPLPRRQIFPCEDICIEDPITIEFYVPEDFVARGKIQLKTKDVGAFKNCSYVLTSDGTFQLPWMENSKYPLAVWFFTVRSLLAKPGYTQWLTPVRLC